MNKPATVQADPTHPSDETLASWSAMELSDEASDEIETHLILCQACARRLDQFADAGQGILRRLRDSLPASLISASSVSARASATDATRSQGRVASGDSVAAGDRSPASASADARSDPPGSVPSTRRPSESRGLSSRRTFESKIGDRWKLDRLLARGGIGEVWIAYDQVFYRRVALKRLRPQTATLPRVRERFLREAHITAELNHPGTPYVLDLFEDGDHSFYVMSLIEGKTLTSFIAAYQQQRRLDEPGSVTTLLSLLNHFVAVANTIAYAHGQGVIHRDIKGDNVVVGDFGQVTVIDWGLAKRMNEPESAGTAYPRRPPLDRSPPSQTRAGARVGTPAYMSPEQVRGETKVLDHRTDAYGLSAMLYEIVTGKPPHAKRTPEATFDAILHQPPPRFASHGVTSLAPLEELCFRGLSKAREDRPESVAEIGRSVQTWISSVLRKEQSRSDRSRLFSPAEDLMVLVDVDHKVTWANPAWTQRLGWSPSELIGRGLTSLVHPDDAPAVIKVLSDSETPEIIEPRMRCKDGSYRIIQWTLSRSSDQVDRICLFGRGLG